MTNKSRDYTDMVYAAKQPNWLISSSEILPPILLHKQQVSVSIVYFEDPVITEAPQIVKQVTKKENNYM